MCVISYLWWKKLPQSTHSETWITQSQHMTVVQLYIKYVFIFWRFDILVYRNGHTNKAYFNFNGPIKQKKKKVTNAWLKYTTPAGAHRAVLLLGNIFQSKMWHVLGLFNIYFTACSCVIFDRFGRIYVFKLPIMHLLKRECVWVWTS